MLHVQEAGAVLPVLLPGPLGQRQRRQHCRPKALVSIPAAQLMLGLRLKLTLRGCCPAGGAPSH